ncbi:hypothetical protein BAUCODRAFT_61034 [Baudoinia panamericana UAMH 10762]|uniref:DNA-directed RNA polymerase III subunit RPC9 n=1 Tax=Baudoinia panamericana (strain UAMH 10762) TaxID=717646 RepID=M2NMI3_BAUPA|nr:uncharacterized protein BAUCODRAFT_61034 [Baudoinia panamericana UAMH 10762]EMD00735.1 hypothetical protein BAUCODRAFT_61034 [Baudoinia panamericana UAMH 10762]
MASLDKHERELKSNKYPYMRNPSAYPENEKYIESMSRFTSLMTERISYPLEEKYRGNGMTKEELDRTLGKEQEEKALTETEDLMILNLAPGNVEMLKPMIENIDDRFTEEEQQIIVDCVKEVYRCDEQET